MPYRTCLSARTATIDVDMDIVLATRLGNFERLYDVCPESLKREELIEGRFVDGDLS
jgi:hypothetical protein